MSDLPTTTRAIVSTLTDDGTITLSLTDQPLRELGDGDVLVKIGAAPINPSDLGMMFAGAPLDEATQGDGSVSTEVTAGLGAMAGRFGKPMVCGNEGAGTVVATGSDAGAAALDGKVVGIISGDAYAEYRVVHHSQCLEMPSGTTPEQAAAWFVNPLTALGMTETMRREGHEALVHTVGASNLGQMLNRICLADGIGLVNLVRRPEQADLLRSQGAEHVVDTSSDTYRDDLVAALDATGATVAFDAIGGGETAGTLLAAMERVASKGQEYSRYGSGQRTQVYVYGRLDPGPIVLHQRFGFSWSVGGWLLMPFLDSIGDDVHRLRRRVADEITTTFASEYGMRVTLDEAVTVEPAQRYAAVKTGEKAVILPHG